MAAKPVTKEGAKWVVGDGRSIKIWDENWLPSTESSKNNSKNLNGKGNESGKPHCAGTS